MKVVAVLPLYPPHSRVGAWLATHELLAGGARQGWEVDVVTYLAAASTYTLEGVTVHGQACQPEQALKGADVVVTHLGDNGKAADHAYAKGIPQVRMVHGWADWAKKRLDDAPPDVAVFNSRSLLERIGWTGPSEVIHPPVWPNRFQTTPGGSFTLANLAREKGAELFWLLARTSFHHYIGIKGGYGSQIVRHQQNVDVLKVTDDMRSVYARTRVMLCPSKEESWGMVGLEAAASGIPTIAAPTEGLKESLGESGIFIPTTDVRGWADTITRLTDPVEWLEASEKALKRSAELDPQDQVDRFITTVEAVCAS